VRSAVIARNAHLRYRSSRHAITSRVVELRHLSVFVAVAQERSFSRAAEKLHVAQSAVSATVRNLEREWGVTLFERTTHRVELSAAGRALLPEARSALRAADAVEHAVDEVRGGLRGTIRVGIMQATPRPGGLSVAAAISAFRARYPRVTVEVQQGASVAQVEAVRAGELDLSFVGLPDTRLPGLTMTTVADPEMQFACHPAHRLAGRRSVELGMLGDEAFADLPPDWGVRVANDRAFAAARAHRTIAYEINDVATVADFVHHGIAVAIMAPVTAAPDAGIAFVPIRHHAPRFTMSLVAPAGERLSPAARAFTEIARRTAAT
jgi:DNA-binding transcriptional LysR family regulator